MRLLPCVLVSVVLAACGSQSQVALTGTSTPLPSGQPAPSEPAGVEPAAIQPDSALTGDDIGATILGDSITIPAFQELQLAAVVSRTGAFFSKDSFIRTMVSNSDQKQSFRLVAFAPMGRCALEPRIRS